MQILRPLRDQNGHVVNLGREIDGDRITLDTNSRAIKFAYDIKGGVIIVESGTMKVIGAQNMSIAPLDAAAAVDSGGGLVSIAAAYHGFVAGQTVTLVGTTNYDGAHVLHANTTTGTMVITATYHAETFTTDMYAKGKRYPLIQQGGVWNISAGREALQTVLTAAAVSGTCVLNILLWR